MKVRTLKELREDKNLTQEEEAREFEITKEYLSMLERAERNPSDKLKSKMANFFGVSTSYIFLSIEQTKRFKKQSCIKLKVEKQKKEEV